MAFRRSLSESRLLEKRAGLPLPLVRRVEDVARGLPRSYSLLSLAARQKQQQQQPPSGYSKPSWWWHYGKDVGWLEQRAQQPSVLGSRWWPSYAHFRRRYDAARPSFVSPAWQPRFDKGFDRSDGPLDKSFWKSSARDRSYYSSYRSWVRSSHTDRDFVQSDFRHSLKMPFFFYNYYKPRTPYMFFF